MKSKRRALLLGLLVWLVPFVVAVVIFPLRESWRALFESMMAVTVTVAVVLAALAYFRKVETAFAKEGVLLGLVWFAMSVLIDLPLMLSKPINMSLGDYAADIGLTYLMIPTITIGFGRALERLARARPARP